MPERDDLSLEMIDDFRRARRRAIFADITARLIGRPNNLLSFEAVRDMLKADRQVTRGLQDVPLDAIIGSVGRYNDFTRHFLPRRSGDEQRWARVKQAALDFAGLPPIEVYQIGEVYFVADGNHRVSVARQLGATHIHAYVTEIETEVPLTPDTSPDELIIKREYAAFLRKTDLKELYPDADLSVTIPGQYATLEAQIEAHLIDEDGRSDTPPYEDGVRAWYERDYLPVVRLIRERGLLRDFPNRTEADLYLWIEEHRAALEEELGYAVTPEAVAEDLAQQRGQTGAWRHGRDDLRAGLFNDILVPLSGDPGGWPALEQAILVARREGGRIIGLHVISSEEDRDDAAIHALQAEFSERCAEAWIPAQFTVAVGGVTQTITDRARWVDLVTIKLTYPPGSSPLERLRSGFRLLIQRCPQPVLIVPGTPSALQCAVLAYDGSPKAGEALFAAAYAARAWGTAITVLTVAEADREAAERDAAATLEKARAYLDRHKVEAVYRVEHGPIAETILEAAANQDLIITGGYGFNAVLEVAFGSTVDHLLRASEKPLLVCR